MRYSRQRDQIFITSSLVYSVSFILSLWCSLKLVSFIVSFRRRINKSGKSDLLRAVMWDFYGNQTKYLRKTYGNKKFIKISPKRNMKCVKRKRYKRELLRFFNVDPKKHVNKKMTILIFGTKTTIGHFLKVKYRNSNKYNMISFRGYFDFDFGSLSTDLIFNEISIKRIYICYQPVFRTFLFNETFSQMILNNFFKNLTSFVDTHKTKCTMFISPPFVRGAYDMLFGNRRFRLVFHPYLVDPTYAVVNNVIDQEIVRTRKTGLGKCEIPTQYDYYISFVKTKEIIKQILGIIGMSSDKGNIYFIDDEKTRLSEYLKSICIFKPYPNDSNNYEIIDEILKNGGTKIQIPNISRKNINNFIKKSQVSKKEKEIPYITFVVAGRNDNYSGNFKKRIQNMFESISSGIEKYPGCNVEVVFVSYRNPINTQHLPYALNIPDNLKSRLKITIITDEDHENIVKIIGNHRKLDFLEFVGKNVASQRTETKFFLFTNGDNIFPEFLFEIFSLRQFNPSFFYKTDRLELSFLKTHCNSSYPWLYDIPTDYPIYKFQYDFFSQQMYFHMIDQKYMETRGLGDFTLLSSEMFNLIKGYDQHPTNWGTDHLLDAKMLGFAPKHISFRLNVPIFHQDHETNHSQTETTFHRTIIKSFKCKGFCTRCNVPFYNDGSYYGFPFINIITNYY